MRFVAIVRRWGLLVLGVVGIVAAVIMLTRPATVSFGWTAYAPLSNTTYLPPDYLDPYFWGTPILVVGTALIAGWVGFALGRRRKRPRHPEAF